MAAIRPSWILPGIAPIAESPPLTASHASSASRALSQAGQTGMVIAVQPLEVSLRAAQRLDHAIGKHGEEFVGQRRLVCEQPIAGIVLDFQKQRVLPGGAGAAPEPSIDQRELAKDAGRAQARQKFSAG